VASSLAEAAEKSWRRFNGLNQLPSSPTESRLSDRKLKPLPPDPFSHQVSAIGFGLMTSLTRPGGPWFAGFNPRALEALKVL
jgi:hypothetical protein